ncbi:limbic system-associated membrane protein isoform X2 [Drosophila obscura]|uniref:limbic system-associated membrane protein isoform X2 n=1 Tax=Drosophila obscura TaxID=7282 RepID=UPI000BA16D86|nr:limbic system-associated membrane protein isoform X2 [Drosophila obscura]
MTQLKFSTKAIAFAIVLLLIKGEIGGHSLPHTQGHSEPDEIVPEFLAQLTNITVPQGRDISFTCVVDNLGQYRVAWIKSDSKAILGIHTHMVSLNPRLSVTHNGHNTWKLHISRVQINDSGSYMCQVNTDPMKSLSGYLDVVVPPDILNHPDHNLEEGVSTEGGSIILVCSATGVPEPRVQWRRETGKDIILRAESRDKQVPPAIKAVNQLVGAPVEREVTLECIVEVYPKPLNGWYRNEGNIKLHNGNKYNISEEMINLYTWHLNLTIRHLTKSDFGAYSCSSVNALGKSETRIRLQELRLPPKSTTTPTPHVHTTAKPRRKQQPGHNKGLNEVVRAKETHFSNQMQQENDGFGGGIGLPQSANSGNAGSVAESGNVNGMINGAEVHTQLPARNGYEKTHKSAGVLPSPRSPWNFASAGSQLLSSTTIVKNSLVFFLYCVLSVCTSMYVLI